MHQDIVQHRLKLERLFGQADKLLKNEEIDSEVVSHFTSYLCVRTSGFVESSLKTIVREYVDRNTDDQRLLNLVDSRFKRIRNPSKGGIIEVAADFGKDWRVSLRNEISGKLETSLNTIVERRNDIAHGRDVDISLRDLRDHFENAKKVVEIIDQRCLASEDALADTDSS